MLDKLQQLFQEISNHALRSDIPDHEKIWLIEGSLVQSRREVARALAMDQGRSLWYYSKRKTPRSDEEARRDFWDSVDKSDPSGCWLWKHGTDSHGYGIFMYLGKRWRTHRLSWVWSNGAIPGKLFVLHKCDTPACVNPEHLFLGTQGDNNMDCISKGRGNRQHGSSRPSAKLNEDQAREIFLAYSGRDAQILADKYGVSTNIICAIKKRKKWKRATKDL